jgi:S1-C subfamily serine protease
LNLDAFIDSQIKALRSEPSERLPRPVGCLVVEKVATTCVASKAGVRKGDLLSLVDGSPAARQSPKLYEHRAAKRLLTSTRGRTAR